MAVESKIVRFVEINPANNTIMLFDSAILFFNPLSVLRTANAHEKCTCASTILMNFHVQPRCMFRRMSEDWRVVFRPIPQFVAIQISKIGKQIRSLRSLSLPLPHTRVVCNTCVRSNMIRLFVFDTISNVYFVAACTVHVDIFHVC